MADRRRGQYTILNLVCPSRKGYCQAQAKMNPFSFGPKGSFPTDSLNTSLLRFGQATALTPVKSHPHNYHVLVVLNRSPQFGVWLNTGIVPLNMDFGLPLVSLQRPTKQMATRATHPNFSKSWLLLTPLQELNLWGQWKIRCPQLKSKDPFANRQKDMGSKQVGKPRLELPGSCGV